MFSEHIFIRSKAMNIKMILAVAVLVGMLGVAVGVGGATLVLHLKARNSAGNVSAAPSQNSGAAPTTGEPVNSSDPNPPVSTLDAQPDEQQEQTATPDDEPIPSSDDETVFTDSETAAAPAAAAPVAATIAVPVATVAPATKVRRVRAIATAVVPVAPAVTTVTPVAATDVADSVVVPAGTTVIVRLSEQLSSTVSEQGQSFSALLDRDVIIHGETAIPAGTSVTGIVTLSRPVGPLVGEANLELKLTSLRFNNANLAVVSSVRSFGFQIRGKSKVSRFMKGLAKRAVGNEREVVLDDQSAVAFTLVRAIQVQ
jgi:hypothetical protein